jgi:hypothetical protein
MPGWSRYCGELNGRIGEWGAPAAVVTPCCDSGITVGSGLGQRANKRAAIATGHGRPSSLPVTPVRHHNLSLNQCGRGAAQRNWLATKSQLTSRQNARR